MISIIVPVYNSSRYLPRCIESILKQDYINFELLLIDDGSIDKSGLICDKYAKSDNRIKVIHKTNQGVSASRNIGIKKARGEYILFIDSDDYIMEDYLNQLMTLQSHNTDLIVCGFSIYIDDQFYASYSYKSTSNDSQEINIGYLIGRLDQNNLLSGPCNKLFRKEIIHNNGLLFDETISIGEDIIFNYAYIEKLRTIKSTDYIGYIYDQRSNKKSLSKACPEYEKFEYIINYTDLLIKKIIDKFNIHYSFYDEFLTARKVNRFFWSIKSLYIHPTNYKYRQIKITKFLKENSKAIINYKCHSNIELIYKLAFQFLPICIADRVLYAIYSIIINIKK